jgi:hypothetical protein
MISTVLITKNIRLSRSLASQDTLFLSDPSARKAGAPVVTSHLGEAKFLRCPRLCLALSTLRSGCPLVLWSLGLPSASPHAVYPGAIYGSATLRLWPACRCADQIQYQGMNLRKTENAKDFILRLALSKFSPFPPTPEGRHSTGQRKTIAEQSSSPGIRMLGRNSSMCEIPRLPMHAATIKARRSCIRLR